MLSGLSIFLFHGVLDAYANPGAMVERDRERVTKVVVADPQVQKVQDALRQRVKDAWYKVTIVDYPDAVVLRGQVDTERSREEILSVARSVSSRPVRDELRLRPSPSDDQIASELRSTLEREYPQLSNRITVDVRDGIAYLSGNMQNHRQVDEILSTVLMLEGVRDIQSDITVAGKPYSAEHYRMRSSSR